MQRPKSYRHQLAARARWLAADTRAQDAGSAQCREVPSDCRDAIELDLTSYGGPRLRIEPRLGRPKSTT